MPRTESLNRITEPPYLYKAVNHDIMKRKTNADHIRAMSDKELAKLITSGELCAICPLCKYYGTEQCYIENEGVHKNCDNGIIGWLQSEVEG